jgi:hypothetical protein
MVKVSFLDGVMVRLELSILNLENKCTLFMMLTLMVLLQSVAQVTPRELCQVVLKEKSEFGESDN